LLLNFDPLQVRYAGVAFQSLYQGVAATAEQTGDSAVAIHILHSVILRLDPTSSTLTPAHYSFIRLCISARAFAEGADILNRPIVSLPFDTEKATLARSYKYLCSYQESSATYLTYQIGLNVKWTYRQYLEYFLMGAMIYMALRQFTKAQFYLEVVLSTPTSSPTATSMLQVEAYKKWVLVSLLLKGKPIPPPRGIPNGTLKNIRALSKAYDCLVEAFKSNSLSHFRAELDFGQKLWQDDNNWGLVIELYHAFRKFQVQKLGNTFAALPFAEVAVRTSPNPTDLTETTNYITRLIANGDLNAILSASPGTDQPTLRFLGTASSSSSGKTEAQIAQSLSHQRAELQALLRAIGNNDHRHEISKEYIDMLKKLKKGKEAGVQADGRPATFEDLDEDMMADE
jgi:COP9 signalosome complex subunit 3